MMTRKQENTEAKNKMNNIISQFNIDLKDVEGIHNSTIIVCLRKLNELSHDLCDSPYWSELIENIEFVNSKRLKY